MTDVDDMQKKIDALATKRDYARLGFVMVATVLSAILSVPLAVGILVGLMAGTWLAWAHDNDNKIRRH